MTLPPYTKPHLSIDQQLRLLESRGMLVTDHQRARDYLERIGYYRLSGYWYPFRQSVLGIGPDGKATTNVIDQFRPGAEFTKALDLYVFDKRLRLIFLDAIERIEIGLRVQIALLLSARDPWAHRSPLQLHGNFATKLDPKSGLTKHKEWLSRVDKTEAKARDDFLIHFRSRYDSNLPIWMAIELWDFGTFSMFFSGMKVADQDAIARKYGLPRRDLLTSWVRAINYVRNVCAHHSRLWNASPIDQPSPPRIGEVALLDHLVGDSLALKRLYGIAAPMQFLLKTINPSSSWSLRLKQHLATFPIGPGISVGQSGFPMGWETMPLWL
jgi:abortive infection bacteriophage resistance protein